MPFKIIVMELRTLKDLFEERRPIKALSIWEPWASLVARGVKRHETRHWSTTYRGPIAIHAAKTLDLAGAPEALCVGALGLFWHKDRPTGVVVAIGELRNVHRAEDVAGRLTRADAAAGNFGYGRFAWEIAKVRPWSAARACSTGRRPMTSKSDWAIPSTMPRSATASAGATRPNWPGLADGRPLPHD